MICDNSVYNLSVFTFIQKLLHDRVTYVHSSPKTFEHSIVDLSEINLFVVKKSIKRAKTMGKM